MKYLIPFVVLSFVVLASFQNCGKQDSLGRTLASRIDAASLDPVDIGNPPVNECFGNDSFNACGYYKNPVFHNFQKTGQTSLPFTPSYTERSMNALMDLGINITGLSPGAVYLDNNIMSVISDGPVTEPITNRRARRTPAGDWKYPYTGDPFYRFTQVLGYYWLQRQEVLMKQLGGVFYLDRQGSPTRRMLVFAYSEDPQVANNAFFAPATFSEDANGDGTPENYSGAIVMGNFDDDRFVAGQSQGALSAEIYTHEMGHANFTFSGPGGASGFDDCPTAAGCVGAIHEGQADFHTVFVFPDSSAVGEMIVNDTSGFTECGFTRDFGAAQIRNATAAQLFNACQGAPGEVHLAGRVYASIWYEVWKNASNKNQIFRLFAEHLKDITVGSTFRQAIQRAITLDSQFFGGANTALFNAEMTRKGI